MKLEQQVVNLELSKKLKKLGVEQDSLWYYEMYKSGGYSIRMDGEATLNHDDLSGGTWDKNKDCISAFTVAELGEMLPMKIIREGKYVQKLETGKQIRNNTEEWAVVYQSSEGFCQQIAETEADARAKMLIYLMENKLSS